MEKQLENINKEIERIEKRWMLELKGWKRTKRPMTEFLAVQGGRWDIQN